MVSHRYEGLEVEEDLSFERRTWKFQRIGRICLALFLLLAFLGFTGSGPMSNASSSSEGDALQVSYERFDRTNSLSTFEVQFTPDLVSNGELEVWISSSFITSVRIEQITPEPDSVESDSDRYVYTFAVAALDRPAPISFQFRPEKPGLANAELGVVDGPEVSVRQVVFP